MLMLRSNIEQKDSDSSVNSAETGRTDWIKSTQHLQLMQLSQLAMGQNWAIATEYTNLINFANFEESQAKPNEIKLNNIVILH